MNSKALTLNPTKLALLSILSIFGFSAFSQSIQNSMIVSGNNSAIISNTSGGIIVINGVNVSDGANVVNGIGPIETMQRSVPSFAGIQLDARVTVIYTVGGKQTISINAQKNIEPLLTTRVENGVLIISLKGSIRTTEPILLHVTGPTLTTLDINGSGVIDMRGASNKSLRASVSGSGSISIIGSTDNLTAVISGSGIILASSLKAQSLKATISGSGGVFAQAVQVADVTISGSGDVKVFGNPKTRSVEKSGSGRVVFVSQTS